MSGSQAARSRPEFLALQREFTRHIRDPAAAPAPAGIEERRMGIYRDLLYRNVEGFLAGSFPVLRRLHGDDRWHALVRDYFRDHRAATPLFPRMPLEFVHYLENERGRREGDFPFLPELAHYEWMETALALDPREPGFPDAGTREADPLAAVPRLSALARPLTYTWPVHRIGPDFLPDAPPPQPTWLLLYRDGADRVHFMEMNAVTARLVDLVAGGKGRTGRQLLEGIAAELGHPGEAVLCGGAAILEDLSAREIVFLEKAEVI
jgi:hypothetical protein